MPGAPQHRLLFSQGIGVGVVEDAALVPLLDEPHGGLLGEMLDLVIGRRRHGHEGRLAAVGMGDEDAVPHQDVEVRISVRGGAEVLHEGYPTPAHVAVAQRRGLAAVAGFQVLQEGAQQGAQQGAVAGETVADLDGEGVCVGAVCDRVEQLHQARRLAGCGFGGVRHPLRPVPM
jgi:hypothetical protein